jgi:hypothetical protein
MLLVRLMLLLLRPGRSKGLGRSRNYSRLKISPHDALQEISYTKRRSAAIKLGASGGDNR